MSLKRVQMLLEPDQHRKLTKLAHAKGISISAMVRLAIELGLEKLVKNENQARMQAFLETARQLRESQSRLDVDIVAELQQLREERDNGLTSGD